MRSRLLRLLPVVGVALFAFPPSAFAAGTFHVANTNDSGAGSLRQAIIDANAAGGGTIDFAQLGGSAPEIILQSVLPSITTPVVIDGTTQPNTSPNAPGVTIDPGSVTGGALLDLSTGSDGSNVRGLAFGGNLGTTGTTAISVESSHDVITRNWIGEAADSTALGVGYYGIQVTGNDNNIGDGVVGDANVITGAHQDAITINSTTGNVVQGNLLGLFADGKPTSGTGNGISVYNSSATVIGNDDGPSALADVQAHPELGNVISGMGYAVYVGPGSSGAVVAGNFIGVDRGGVPTGLNADGIVVAGSSGNQIGPGDMIAHATHDGVSILGGPAYGAAASNRIVANSIFDSGHLGIDEQGANNGIAAPVITSISGDTVFGTFASASPDAVYIELFVNPTCGAPYANGAGQTYVNFQSAAPGFWSATVPGLTDGEGVTVTATDQVTNDTSAFSNCAIRAESIAFESNRVNSTSQIFTMNPDGSNVVQLTHDPTGTVDTLPSISPDGHTVVYQSNVTGTPQIWAINGDGTGPRQLTTQGSNFQPTFSPDGKKIAFDSTRTGKQQLFVMNADGTGQTQVMATNGNVGGSSWSPDGTQIAFNDDTSGTNEIYTVNVGTTIVTGPLTTAAADGANRNPHWSPDGSKILFVSNRCDPAGLHQAPTCGGGESVFLMNADGTNQQNLTDASIFDADPAWSPDGTRIAFVRDLGGQNFNVFTANADGTNQVQLTFGSAPSRNSFPNWGTQVGAPASPFTNLTVNATPSSAGAGIDQVTIGQIPNAWLSFYAGSTTSSPVGSTPVGSTPVGSTPVGSTPVGSTPVGSTPVGSTPVGSTPVGSTPVGSTGLLDLPVGSTPVGSTALSSLLLSQIPLCGDALQQGTNAATCQSDGATWPAVLAGTPLAGRPLNALTLADVVNPANAPAKARLAALPLKDVSFATALFRSVRWSSLLLGSTPLDSLPVPDGFDSWCGGTNPALPTFGGSCANVTSSTSVLQMDVSGQLGSAPVGSTPVGSTPVGSTPVGSTPVGSTDILASLLANIPLSDISPLAPVVTCSASFDCTGKTLGDAYRADAIVPTATFFDIAGAMASNNITINDVLIAVLGAAGLPWEQLPIQGLQPYSQTPSTVHYTVSTNVDCSAASQFTLTARLPKEFFPVNNSAQFSIGNHAPSGAGAPTVLSSKLNAYRWSVSCPAGDTSTETATLSFDAWVGLTLGTFTTAATAASSSAALSTTGAPVTVHQNPEASDPSTATEVKPDTLVAGHIAFSGEQAFYKVKLTDSQGNPLPTGTKISAFLNVPSGADLDLTMSAPAAPSFFSTPVGSTPVGSTPIEDSAVGFASNGLALPPDTLDDVPVGSTPVGSTPVGSTPVGSTSANRGGGINEDAGIITAGQGGYATIGVSGYNGATSTHPFVLRVQETPPPPLPACPARTFQYGAPSTFAAGTLPSSLPATTKTLFLVDKQRLLAMYQAADVNAMLTTLGTLAARSEVGGTILYVDGNAAVRSAYSAWDSAPCDTTARNNVVRSINDVVASYRNSATGLPNLHYIVLVGSDEAGPPMADAPDPVLLSPEENEAGDLAFTTDGLTKGNALYASAARNQILTDGAYGAFTNIPWLGRSLLLPQISVSRLVETPGDITGQINRYLGNNGISAPQSAAGTLNPTSALVTGYDFLADGAQAVESNLRANFSALTPVVFTSGNPAINVPGSPWKASTLYNVGDIVHPTTANPLNLTFQAQNQGTSGSSEPTWPTSLVGTILDGGVTWQVVAPWNAVDVTSTGLAASSAPSILALNAHYNQYELESAAGDLANSGQASAALAARILFTMGCHGGLNIPDSLGGTTGRYLDWPELYAQKQAAMYIANTGFGYGDSASVALSERLMSLFAKNLRSDPGSVGEEWVNALQQYFATAGAYDVYDEKVMEETTFYGLPFWHFSGAPNGSSFTPLTTSPDPAAGGTQSATITFPTNVTTGTQFGLYRPNLPISSQQVTSNLPARGVWIKQLASNDTNTTANIGYPTIDLSAHEPAPDVSPIFFPASPFTLERSLAFGSEKDYLNVSDQFRPTGPGDAGVDRHFTGGQFEILYSQSADQVAPLISQVNVSASGGVATITARVTDDSGHVAEVAALVNDGTGWRYLQLNQSSLDPTLWSNTISVARDPEVFVEATDGVNVSYSANKGENFTSTNSNTPPGGVQILLQAPVGPYAQGQTVYATYQCGAAAAQCLGSVPNGSKIDTSTFGVHTFTVQAFDADGNVIGSLERTYVVQYPFDGFFAPVDNEPVLNVVKAGSAIPVIFSLGGNQGLSIFASGYPKSQAIACDATAPADGIDSTVTAGGSSLSYDSSTGRYTYVWKTDKSWVGTCRALILKMQDGTTHRADFRFK